MKSIVINKKKLNISNYINIISIVLLLILFTAINKNFLSIVNIKNLLTDISPLLVMACGVTFVLLLGSIDLSIGAICSCSAVIFAILLPQHGYMAYIVAIVFGIIAGFLNGIIFTKVKIPSFIATLGTMSVWQSLAYIISDGAPLQIKIKHWGFLEWAKIKVGIVPMTLIVALVILFVFYIVQKNTKLGKYSYAIGANERAARLAGVSIDLVKLFVFTINGLCCALAGIFLSVKLKSGIPTVGNPFQLMGIAAVVLGGTALTGGKGGVLGTLIGVATVKIIQNGMNVIGVNTFWQNIVFGIIIILALILTADRSGRDSIVK